MEERKTEKSETGHGDEKDVSSSKDVVSQHPTIRILKWKFH